MVNCLCVSTCGKAFASNRKLCYHQNRCKTCQHTAKYRCGKCSKMFSTPHRLKEHQLVHSDVRRFSCGLCDKSFKRKVNLKQHVLTHIFTRNFKCHICDRRFNRKDNFTRHLEGHFGIKSFKCTVCDRGFAQYTAARRHEENCRQNNVSVSDSSSDDDDDGELNVADNGLADGDVKMDFNECGEDTD